MRIAFLLFLLLFVKSALAQISGTGLSGLDPPQMAPPPAMASGGAMPRLMQMRTAPGIGMPGGMSVAQIREAAKAKAMAGARGRQGVYITENNNHMVNNGQVDVYGGIARIKGANTKVDVPIDIALPPPPELPPAVPFVAEGMPAQGQPTSQQPSNTLKTDDYLGAGAAIVTGNPLPALGAIKKLWKKIF